MSELLSDNTLAALQKITEQPGHAYLLVDQGNGSALQAARQLATQLLQLPSDAAILAHPNLTVVRHLDDKKSISIKQISTLLATIAQSSHNSSLPKVVLVEEADLLGLDAANALLKNLEDPVGNTIFLLTTGKASAILPTIISRCERCYITPAELSASKATKEVQAKAREFVTSNHQARFAIAAWAAKENQVSDLLSELVVAIKADSSILEKMPDLEFCVVAEGQISANVNARFVLENLALVLA